MNADFRGSLGFARDKLFVVFLYLLFVGGCAAPEAETVTPPIVAVSSPTATVTEPATVEPSSTPTSPMAEATPAASVTSTDEPTATAAATDTPVMETPSPTATVTLLPTVLAQRSAQPVTAIQLEQVSEGFSRPTFLTHAGDDRLFVSEQPGIISIIQGGQRLETPFLDIRDRVTDQANEQGLLSVVFHPDYVQNGRFFVNYTAAPDGRTIVSSFQVSDDANVADPDSEQVVLTIEQPYGNHNGGQLQFGPDGTLYIGMGDGGSGGDPHGHGQNTETLLGALLRIDVDQGEPYGIPADNPFAGDEESRGEIWAYGLRNPWRFSFDRLTGDLYMADVGQNAWEEVNFQPAESQGGENYGWNILEGSHCYANDPCDATGTVLPVTEYSRDAGCSVTGGYVYRGAASPALWGNYFFADYCSGIIWSLFHEADGSWTRTQVYQHDGPISSFGEDQNGELYVVGHDGRIWQVQAVP